ncbi:c-type cytochrome [Dyadobacter sp. 32]|uniref:c-type cytochrome n=1 Tax=Dyadobacter sp. 32 TaxID=538966 RepID=UPI0011EF9C5F
MKIKILKRTGLVLLSIVILLVAGYFGIAYHMKGRTSRQYSFESEKLDIPSDSASIARGRHLSIIKGCQDCHGTDLGGKVMMDDGGVGTLSASNLTRGKGGLPEGYTTEDWVMSLRHGVDQSGVPLIFMPSHETTLLSAEDMSAIIAYCMHVPAVDRELPQIKLGPVANVMGYLGKMPLLAVERINHTAPMLAKADTTESIEQGRYLAISCSGCHQSDFKGGDPVAPGMPPVPDITSSGAVGAWTQTQFIQTLRSGKTPAGHQLKNEEMPWKMTAQYEQKELASLYKYFRSI